MNGKLASLIAILLLCLVPAAQAHAVLLSAVPGAGEVLGGPDTEIQLRFNSRVDSKRSTLVLITPSGEQRRLDLDPESLPDCVNSRVKGLKSGGHVLRWQVLAIDGHITRGEVPFRVR
jgi:methionine-rich copper-binding protein CopC